MRRPLAWAAAVAVSGCYSPDYDVTGKYEIRWTTVATATLSWPESTKCDGPGGPESTISEVDIVQDPNYAIVVHLGCKVPVKRRGSVLQTGGFEKCELVPGSPAEALGWKERYYDIRLDLTSGEMYLATRNLGENASGSCHVMDAHVRRPGGRSPKRSSKFWFYEGTGGALAERYRGIWHPSGYIEERADGTLYVQGLGCTLPGRTPPGETAEVPDGACRTGVFAEYGAPELAAQRYSFNDTEFSMSGEYHGVDRDYTFEIQSTSVRPDDWDSRHE